MAIAFVGAADLGNNGGGDDLTVAYTVGGGSDRLLVVGVVGDTGSDLISGVTYNGTAMTLADSFAPGNRYSYLFYLLNPSTGSNNVVVTNSSNCYILAQAADYSGVGSFDAKIEAQTAGTATTKTTSLTTIAADCWIILYEHGYDAVSTSPTAGTGATRRVNEAAFGLGGLFDTNGTVSAGSNSMQTNRTFDVTQITHFMVSFAPPGGGGGRTTHNTRAFPLGMAIGMNWVGPGDCSEPILRRNSGIYVPRRLAA